MACQTLHLPWQPSRYIAAPLSAALHTDCLQGAQSAAYLWMVHVLYMAMEQTSKSR